MPLETRHIYKFGEFSLDATAKVVLRNGEPIRLARKAVETLLVLLEHPDQVLTKDELIEAIWRGRVVDDANLAQNIAVVRRALQVAAGSAGYIETFPGRGYRLVGPILEGEEKLHGPGHLAPAIRASTEVTEPLLPRAASQPAPDIKAVEGSLSPRILWAAIVVLLVATGVLWLGVPGRRVAPESRLLNFRRSAVARLGGKEYQPAISADGNSIAFVLNHNDGRPSGIWSRAAPARAATTIFKEGWDYSSPVWSPDAKSLAYLRFNAMDGEVVVASADGSKERVVTKVFASRFGLPHRHLDWSPSGQLLAFDDTGSPERPFGIFVISVASGERRRVSTAPEDSIGDVDPRFSPDGKRLSFIRVFHRARQGLFAVGTNGADLRRLSSDAFQISGQDWTSDGKALVMASNRTGEFRLWRISGTKPDDSPAADGTGVYGDAPIQLSIARRKPVLLYAQLQENFNIWRLDLNVTANASAERWKPVVSSSAEDASPQYSPDGRQICFRSDRTGEEQLWASAADGSSPQQVTQGALRPSVGRWSPDGRGIVFNDSREGDLYLARRDGAENWQTVALGVKGTHPVFSTDGRWIFAGRNELIFKLPAGGGALVSVAAVRGLSFGVSPDGGALYFVRKVVDPSLWQVSLESGQISKVLDGLVPYCTSCWAAGVKGIYYLGSARTSLTSQAIYLHSFSTGREKLIAEYPEPLLPIGSGPFSLSPDGRYLLCVRVGAANSDVMQIDPYR